MPRLAQPFGSTSIEVNKQSIARYFGVKQSEVIYFAAGVDLGGYKVIYDKVQQRAYSLPTGISAGTTAISLSSAGVLVHSAGSVDLGALAVTREEYVTLPGSFTSGATLTVKNELLVYLDSKYRWGGEFPKTIPANSTPASTGGVSNSAWIPVGDITLRSELASPNGINLLGGVSSTATPGYGLKFGDTSGIPTIEVADDTAQRVLFTKDVTHPDDLAVVQINRNANYSGGTVGFVGSALCVRTDIKTPSSVGTFEWAGLFIMNNKAPANTSGGGPGSGAAPQQVALYGQANKDSTSATWASCMEINDNQGTSANGPAIGQEITVRAIGADTPTPSRVGTHVAAHTPDNNSIGMEWGIAFYATSDTAKDVRFRDVFRVDAIVGNAVLLSNATTNQVGAALIKDKGSLTAGIDLSGATYSSAVALRLKVAQRISLDENDTNQLYSSSAGIIAKGRVNMTNSFAVPSSGNVTGTATAGGVASLPATVSGFISIMIDGVTKKIPFYNA